MQKNKEERLRAFDEVLKEIEYLRLSAKTDREINFLKFLHDQIIFKINE